MLGICPETGVTRGQVGHVFSCERTEKACRLLLLAGAARQPGAVRVEGGEPRLGADQLAEGQEVQPVPVHHRLLHQEVSPTFAFGAVRELQNADEFPMIAF